MWGYKLDRDDARVAGLHVRHGHLGAQVVHRPAHMLQLHTITTQILNFHTFLFGALSAQNYHGLCSLEINRVTADDIGTYIVKATNHFGNASCNASLEVEIEGR